MVRRDEALRALRCELTRRQFATVLQVADGGPAGFLVRIRASRRLHPHTPVLAADERSLTLDHGVAEPLLTDDVQMWADGVAMWSMEQLDIGVLRWGRRVTLEGGTVSIDPSLDLGPSSQWWVSSVPLQRPTPAGQRRLQRLVRGGRRSMVVIGGGRTELEPNPAPGGRLRYVGFDVAPARVAYAEGGLVQWLQLFPDRSGG